MQGQESYLGTVRACERRGVRETATRKAAIRRCLLAAAGVLLGTVGLPRVSLAYSDAEITTFLRRRFSCPVLAPEGMVSGLVRGADAPVQVFLYGAEGCSSLGFSGGSFAAVLPRGGTMSLLAPQPLPTGVNSVALRDGYVIATSFDYAPNDPRCCPSRQVSQRWVISGSRLIRVP